MADVVPIRRVDESTLVADLVAVLFVAGEAVERRAIQRALGITPSQLGRVLAAARAASVPGLTVQEQGDQLRLVTHPSTAPSVRQFLQAPNAIRLTAASLETLAVIAYGQPTTRAEVTEARGVESDGPISTLLQHGLILEIGRSEGPGRPTLFGTTGDFLSLLGIGSLEELPRLQEDANQL